MANYTKGPWIVKEQPVKHLGFYIQQDGFRESQRAFIGECGGGNQEFEQIEANAKLIAAAPDLLEALLKLQDVINRAAAQNCVHAIETDEVNMINAAIAKAVQP